MSLFDHALSGPALRLELIKLLLPVAGTDVVALARAAESFIGGGGDDAIVIPAAIAVAPTLPAPEPDDETVPDDENRQPLPDDAAETGLFWTPERMEELYRLWLAGWSAQRIADAMDTTKWTIRAKARTSGISQRYPRGPGGALKYTAIPLDADPALLDQLYPDLDAPAQADNPEAAEDRRDVQADGDIWERAVRAMLAAGKAVNGHALARWTGRSQSVASKALRGMESDGLLRRIGGGSHVRFVLAAPPPEETPAEAAKPKRDYAVVVWTPERRQRLAELVETGAEAEEIAADLGLGADQIRRWIPEQNLTKAWADARARKRGESTEPAYIIAPPRPPLPEDRLRAIPQDDAPAPADMETVVDYLRSCGQRAGRSDSGAPTLDGCAVPPRRLIQAANTYRLANGLPPFSVRGV